MHFYGIVLSSAAMKTLEEVLAAHDAGKKLKYLLFWGHRPHPSGDITASCLSQWWATPFKVNNHTYPTAEHWMMAEKARLFDDGDAELAILKAKSPGEAKKIGRQVKNFDQSIWEAHRFQIVVAGNFAKFGQNPALKDFLIDTKQRVLVEASPVDPIWGIGLAKEHAFATIPPKWRGLNLLGFALMTVREQLTS